MSDFDPFAEFDQVEETKIKVSSDSAPAILNYLEQEQEKRKKEASFSNIKDCFPSEFQAEAEVNFNKRLE